MVISILHQSHAGITRPCRRLGAILLTALAVAASVSMGSPTVAIANPITYNLDGASANFGVSGTVSFTGSFVFDTTTSTVTSASITATGPLTAVTASPVELDMVQGSSPYNFTVVNGVDEIDLFTLAFSNSLANAQVDPLGTPPSQYVPTSDIHPAGGIAATSVRGSADPVPAPVLGSGFSGLLVAAVSLMWLTRRPGRRGHGT